MTAVLTVCGLALGGAISIAAPAEAAVTNFTAGDVVVYRVGTGSAALSSSATAVSLDEYSPSGSAVQSVALPTATSGSNNPVTASGSASSEGLLTLSADSNYLVASGYNAIPGTANPSGSTSTVPRTIARVDASDTINSSTSLTDAAPGNNIRSATSADGKQFWVGGAAGGVRYATLGATTSTQLTTVTNVRQVQDVGGQLYTSGDSSKAGNTTVATVGNGLPTTSGQSVSNLVTVTQSPQPYGYSLLTLGSGSTPDTLYVGDQTNGAVTKYSLSNGTWTSKGSVNLSGVDGVTANDVQGVVTIYATTASGLYKITDSSGAGGTLSGSASQLATAGANTAFRGVAFAPGTVIGSGGTPPPNPAPTVTSANAGLPAALGDATVPSTTLTVADTAYPASQLTVTGTSSNQNVAANSGISITGSGGTRTLAVSSAGATGKATITLTVTAPDGQTGTTTVTYGVSPDVGQASARYYSGAGNASAAVDVGGGYAVLGDDENNVLRLYNLGQSGPPVKTFDFSSQLPFGTTEIDIEGAARSGNTIYWEGSMSNTSGGNLAPARSTVFATTVSGTGANTTLTYAGAYTGLRQDLITWDQSNGNALGLAASAASGVGGHQSTALNLEGIEFANNSNTLYLAFRAPLEPTTNRHLALLVPLTNVAADIAAGASATGVSSFGSPVELDLGGLGVRDIKENSDGAYLIIGGTADDSNTGFVLYYWDGNPADDPQPSATLPQLPAAGNAGSWETIAGVPQPLTAGSGVRLIQDDGTVDWYGDGLTTKSGQLPDLQKSLGVTFAYAAPATRASATALSQDSGTSAAGQRVTYTATVAPASGNGTPTGTVDFSDGGSDISGCAAQPVSGGTATCTVTYRVTGTHRITAAYSGDGTYTGSSATALTHTVTGAALDHLTLSPATTSTPAGTAVAFSAEGYDTYGNDLGDVTGASTFTISPASGASCTANSCTATGTGTYTVTATDGSATGNAELDVTAGPLDHLAVTPAAATVSAGTAQPYAAEGYDQYGNDLGDVTGASTFSISGNGTCAQNSCSATSADAYTVTATDGSATGTATLTVVAGPVATLTLAPADTTTTAGTAVDYTAEGYDQYGNDTGDETGSAMFSIAAGSSGSDTGAACPGASCSATAAGGYVVSASVASATTTATGSTTLTVTAGPLSTLTLSPANASVPTGGSQAYTATGADAYGNSLGDVTADTAFTITGDGSCTGNTCTAPDAGTFTVTGQDGTVTGTASLTATPPAPPQPVVTGVSPSGGSTLGGRTVTITGTDLGGASDVRFGTTAATGVTVVSATQVTAVSPAHSAGTVNVRVTTDGGTSASTTADRYVYTAPPRPRVISLSPTHGLTSGGTTVTINGQGLTGVTSVAFGGTSTTNITPISSTQLSVVSPAHPAATVDVGVTSPGGTSAASGGDKFTFTPPTPSVSSVSPATGTTLGGTTVTVSGAGFTKATEVDFGSTPGTNLIVVSDTQLKVTSPKHAAGAVNVTVTSATGTSTAGAPSTFTFVAPAPAVTKVSPSSGSTAGGTKVTITGTAFVGATAVAFGTVAATSFTVVSNTMITAVSPAQGAGTRNVLVTTPSGTSQAVSADRFSYVVLPPTITAVSPKSGPAAGGTTVTITGSHFNGTTGVSFGGVAAASFTVVSGTKITAVTPAGSKGAAALRVTNADGTSPAVTFTYT